MNKNANKKRIADDDKSPDGRLMAACNAWDGDIEDVKAALNDGADLECVDLSGGTPLLRSAQTHGDCGVPRYLISIGADITVVDDDNRNVLHGFAEWGHLDLIERAVAAGCDVNARDPEGHTPLGDAVDSGSDEAAVLLIRLGANPLAETELGSGVTPFNFGSLAVLDASLAAGVPVDSRSASGITALMGSAMQNDPDRCAKLIELGADLDAVDNNGMPAIAHAAQRGSHACLAMLLDAGAKLDFVTKDGHRLEDYLKHAGESVQGTYRSWKARQAMQIGVQAARSRSKSP